MEKVSYGLHVGVWLLATTAAILISIAAYRDDAIIQTESLSQYSEYGVTCGITATWQQSQKIDGTHQQYFHIRHAASGTFNKMLLGGTGGRISDYHPSEGEAEDK